MSNPHLKANPETDKELYTSALLDIAWTCRFLEERAKPSGTERLALNRVESAFEKMDKIKGLK